MSPSTESVPASRIRPVTQACTHFGTNNYGPGVHRRDTRGFVLRSRTAGARGRTPPLVVGVIVAVGLVACSSADSKGSSSTGNGAGRSAQQTATGKPTTSTTMAVTTTTLPPPTLPDGTRSVFPEHRVVAYYGGASTPALGVLGHGSPDEAVQKLQAQAAAYQTPGRPVLLALELIGTIADGSPGSDGAYRSRSDPASVQEYLDAARRAHALLVIDVQPGQANFLDEVRYYEPFLRQPDVGLAMDAEWSMRPGQVPGQVIGSTDAATINSVSDYLDGLVDAGRLPQKLLVVHQFTFDMVQQPEQVLGRQQLAVTFHIDGFGGPEVKTEKYAALHKDPPLFNGFKLFYTQDQNMMPPEQVVALQPAPDLITYQ